MRNRCISPQLSRGVAGGAADDPYLQLLFVGFGFSVLWLFNKETVVAAFFQLHNDIQEAGGAASGAFGKSFVIPG